MMSSLLRQLPAEPAHKLAVQALRHGAGFLGAPHRFANLHCDPGLGRAMLSPLGLAAGFDKDADAILGAQRLGFGAVEVGSITPLAQPGNARPRVFRLREDQGVINRYGFNSRGAEHALKRLAQLKRKRLTGPLGINLGKNKTSEALDDYRTGLEHFAPHADYLTINLSSPNTPGLRDQQNLTAMTALIEGLEDAWPDKPVLVKLAPDLDDQDLTQLVEYLATTKVHGLILGNTTLSRPLHLSSTNASEAGGLSGAPLYALALQKLRVAATVNKSLANDRKLILVGCGGVDSAMGALGMIRSGASVVQLYSALTFHGPGLVGRMNAELSARLDSDNIRNISDLVGIDIL